jgi:hypothetical protein
MSSILQQLDLTPANIEYHSWLCHPFAIAAMVIVAIGLSILIFIGVKKKFSYKAQKDPLELLRERLVFLEQNCGCADQIESLACVCLTDIIKGFIAHNSNDSVIMSYTDEQFVKYLVNCAIFCDRDEMNMFDRLFDRLGGVKYAGGSISTKEFEEYIVLVKGLLDRSDPKKSLFNK